VAPPLWARRAVVPGVITLTQPKVRQAKIRGSQKGFQWVILGLHRAPGVLKGVQRGIILHKRTLELSALCGTHTSATTLAARPRGWLRWTSGQPGPLTRGIGQRVGWQPTPPSRRGGVASEQIGLQGGLAGGISHLRHRVDAAESMLAAGEGGQNSSSLRGYTTVAV
jgi:hypothetical protein